MFYTYYQFRLTDGLHGIRQQSTRGLKSIVGERLTERNEYFGGLLGVEQASTDDEGT